MEFLGNTIQLLENAVSNLLIKEFDDVGNVLENETSYEYNTNNTLKKIIRNSGGSYENTDLFYYANDFLEEISQSQYPALYEDLLQFNDYYSDLPIEFISTRLDSQTGSELVVLGAHHELGESNGATNIKETAVLSFPNGSIDFSTFVLAKDNNGAKDSRYIAKNSLSFNKGKLTGSSISSSVHRTNILSKNEQNVVCSFVHSKPLDSRFENFESLPENPLDGFVLGDNSMTGYKGAEIDVAFGSNDPNDLFTIVIDPESQSGKFQLALWVNTESNYQSNLCKLQLFTSDSTGGINTIYPANTSQIESLKEILIPNTQGVWKMIRTNIDLESIRAAANLPNDDLYLVVKMVNSDLSAKVFVDDLKLSTSNLYSINSAYDRHNRLTSVCYDNENCLNFEYDEFGRLKRERDSDGNLIHEYNYEFDLQGSEGNFIERVLLKQEVADPTNIPNLNGYAKQVTREFSDDLGRKIQVVKAGSSPLKRDQVLYTEYDEFGRMKRSYMPYSHSSDGDGSFKEFASVEQGQFYSNASRVAHTNFPYSEFKFDGSPLNRVEEKGHQGEQWELSSGETTEKKIKFNAADEIVSWLIDASGDLVYNDYYPENALKIVEEIDADNQITLLITDKYGNQILRRKKLDNSWIDTYKIFDEFGQIRFVIQPQGLTDYLDAVNALSDPTVVLDPMPFIQEYLIEYQYDELGRMITKKLPGSDLIDYYYNSLDQVVLIQNGNQRADDLFSFNKYDRNGRIILTGIYDANALGGQSIDRTLIESEIANATELWETRSSIDFANRHGYSQDAYPAISLEILTAKYYDDYDFDWDGLNDIEFVSSVFEPIHSTYLGDQQGVYEIPYSNTNKSQTRGLPTCQKAKVLNGPNAGQWIAQSSWYDSSNREIQTRNEHYANGFTLVDNYYNFAGDLRHANIYHEGNPDNDNSMVRLNIKVRNEYDHAGRLERTFTQFEEEKPVLISKREL